MGPPTKGKYLLGRYARSLDSCGRYWCYHFANHEADFQATTEAGLLLATEAARAHYKAAIEAGAGDRLLPTAAVYRLHSDAMAAARNLFTSRRIMGNRQRIDEALTQLMQVPYRQFLFVIQPDLKRWRHGK